ncbi:MAG TPA: hypothetical protein DCO79_03705 [Spirochaeta sp.]|nr:hypothetical protein [Spirochaeta sp.]
MKGIKDFKIGTRLIVILSIITIISLSSIILIVQIRITNLADLDAQTIGNAIASNFSNSAAAAEESSSMSEELSGQADKLLEMISFFKTDDRTVKTAAPTEISGVTIKKRNRD